MDATTIEYVRTPGGLLHSDNMLIVNGITPSGCRSLCNTTGFVKKPYLYSGGVCTDLGLPQALLYKSGDQQCFTSIYKDDSGYLHVYFSEDSGNDGVTTFPHINYNRKSPGGSWLYASSPAVVTHYAEGSTAVMSVIYDGSSPFVYSGSSYSYIMHIVNQTGGWLSTAGVLDVAFSNNGISWTTPVTVNYPASVSCSLGICLEYGTAVWDGGTLYIIGLNGNLATLAANIVSGSTETYVYTSNPSTPDYATQYSASPITSSGLYSPNVSGYSQTSLLTNTICALSISNGYVYVSRSYAYPVDYSGTASIPCGGLTGCNTGLTTLANRAQMYYMYLGIPADITKLWTGSWTLAYDVGYGFGYRSIN